MLWSPAAVKGTTTIANSSGSSNSNSNISNGSKTIKHNSSN